MDYKKLVTKSFSLVWQYKWLWVFGLFAGGGGGFGGNGSGWNLSGGKSDPWPKNGDFSEPNIDSFFREIQHWASTHVGLIVGIVFALALFCLVMMVFSIISQGALVEAANRLDQEEKTSFGQAFKVGAHNFWSILGFFLLLFLILFVIGMMILFLGIFLFFISPVLLILLVPLVLVFIPVVIAIGIISTVGIRFIVIDGSGAGAAIGQSWQLLKRRLGPLALTWLISIGLAIAFGIAIVISLMVLLVPTGVAAYLAFKAGFTAAKLAVFFLIGLVILAALLVAQGAFGAYLSTYWTLAFRQMRALDAADNEAPATG